MFENIGQYMIYKEQKTKEYERQLHEKEKKEEEKEKK